MSVAATHELAGPLGEARRRTLELIAHLSREDLERVVDPLLSPLVWDLAHIAAYEDLWICHRLGGLPLLHPEHATTYDAFETPRAARASARLLDTDEALAYLEDVRERSDGVLARDEGVRDGSLIELVLCHELQHTETMRQAMALGGLLPPGEPPALDAGPDGAWRLLDAGSFVMGAEHDGFAYDNERPAHAVRAPGHAIAARPVTNAQWLAWRRDGGYERREWWSAEGWAWLAEQEAPDRSTAATGPPEAPVCHVSWHEASAYARAADARLPTEAEWERAAKAGVLTAVGQVWEWTSSPFVGYPGFRARPYRQYSEVFFGGDYRVLRGGSWATHPRVGGVTLRNWDLPQRRQIFSGLRLAADVDGS